MQEHAFETRDHFRRWLDHHHDKCDSLWLVYYKKNTGLPSITYEEAVEEALCFGWIDSKIKKIDELRYKQVFTPRKQRSSWSDKNKERAEKLIVEGRMREAGLKAIASAKENGMWKKTTTVPQHNTITEVIKASLAADPQALENFNNYSESVRKNLIRWFAAAKRPETKKKRMGKILEWSKKNQKPGMI